MTRLEKQWLVDVLEKRRFLERLKAVDEKMQKDILNEIEAQIKRQLKQYYNYIFLLFEQDNLEKGFYSFEASEHSPNLFQSAPLPEVSLFKSLYLKDNNELNLNILNKALRNEFVQDFNKMENFIRKFIKIKKITDFKEQNCQLTQFLNSALKVSRM